MSGDLEPQGDRRRSLLSHNLGIWEGQFIRLDPGGRELNRFGSHLAVEERDGLIEASLTNRDSGELRRMAFREPPAAMQISPQGHWSLGPDRIGPWPWVSELCLVHGDQRRRAVVRLDSDQLESLVVVWEGRPGQADPPPAPPLQARATSCGGRADAEDPGRTIWTIEAGLAIVTPDRRRPGSPQSVVLRWQPRPDLLLEIGRAYDAYGNLLGLGAAAGADWPGSAPP
ncbi:MAG: DUF3598 family protein [Cyanobium sp.]